MPVIFIGHKKTFEGMQKTRRLFTTLNRYAKPVSMSDIVALDEDDSAAILTRHLVENFELFIENRVAFSQQKAIPENNKQALTSIITFYQCNVEIVKFYYSEKLKKRAKYKKISFTDFLKIRPSDTILNNIVKFCEKYWTVFSNEIDAISEYLSDNSKQPALHFRNNVNGGHILFRPIGLLPFVQATIMDAKLYTVSDVTKTPFSKIIKYFNDQNFLLEATPWKNVAWDSINKTMKTSGNKKLIKLLFLYFANKEDPEYLSEKDIQFIKNKYASFIGYEGEIEDISLSKLFRSAKKRDAP